jgi:hypothetical protein
MTINIPFWILCGSLEHICVFYTSSVVLCVKKHQLKKGKKIYRKERKGATLRAKKTKVSRLNLSFSHVLLGRHIE